MAARERFEIEIACPGCGLAGKVMASEGIMLSCVILILVLASCRRVSR